MARAVLPSRGGYSFTEQSEFTQACEEAKRAYRESRGEVPEPRPLPDSVLDRVPTPDGVVEPEPPEPEPPTPEQPTWEPPKDSIPETPSSPPKQCLIAFMVAGLGVGARLLPFLRMFRDRFVPVWVSRGYYRFSAMLLSRT